MTERKEMLEMSDIQLLERCGDIAMRWAEAFCAIKESQGFGIDDIDEGLMTCWFANAIEQASSLRSAATTGADVAGFEKAIRNLADEARRAVGHVGYANYAEREAEARKWIREAEESAIAALPAPAGESVTGWQDIETAPKDGTPVLLGWPTFHPLVGHCEDDLWGELDSDFGFEPFENAPTHWQPLPKPPTITRKSEPRS